MSEKTRAPQKDEPEAPKPPTAESAASKRRLEGRANVVIASLIVLAIAGMANYLSFRHYARWDWTSQQIYTLSDRSRATLRELDADVDIYFVISSAEASYHDLRELLQRYRAEQQRITLHFVDPDRDRTEYEVIAQRFGLAAIDVEDSVRSDVAMVIVSGDRQWKVTREDLVPTSYAAVDEEESEVDVRSEQAITGGILEATAGRRTRVCITQGHGEWTLGQGGRRDLGGLEDEMRRDNLEIQTFQTRGAARVPEGCDAVLVVSPATAFASEEADLLRDYVRGGGNLLVAVDPVIRQDEIAPTGLEDMLRDFGIRVDRALVLELDSRVLLPPGTNPAGPFFGAAWGEHPITEPYRASPVGMIVDMVRSVRPIDPDRATTLVSTSDSAYAETDIASMIATGEPVRDDADLAGPVSFAVATRVERLGETDAEDESAEDHEGGRVVVIGDADFLTGELLAAPEVVNYGFATGIVGWLTEREALIELPGRRVSAQPVRMTLGDVYSLGFRVVILLPLAFCFLGFAVWWNRRS